MLVKERTVKSVVIPCESCGLQPGDVRGYYEIDDDDAQGQAGTFVLLVECPGCHEPFVASLGWAWVGNDFFSHDDHPAIIHPDNGDQFNDSVPPAIVASYAEAVRSFQGEAYTGTAILCRRALEGICKHFKARGKNLFAMLSDLKNKGKLDPRLHAWADHVLRPLGNDAAHDVDIEVDDADASDALEFTKALIHHLFVLEHAFEAFKKRRGEAKQLASDVKTVLTRPAKR
jgi:hypothetical protein